MREYNIKFVAIYLRKSRGEEEDLIKHKTKLLDICRKNNWKYVIYTEIGNSDSLQQRPEMKRLLDDIENELYDAVLVIEFDRLSRGDEGQQDKIKKAIRKSNTLIITPNKIYDLNNDIDDTYIDFQGLLARQEYKIIKRRFRQGKIIGAKLGNWTNGSAPFPYEYERYKEKYNPKGLVVNDEKLEVYKYIIQKALDGVSPANIAHNLNIQGILSPRGNKWSNVAIHRILTNEVYLGKIISNKTRGNGHKNKSENSLDFERIPKENWLVVENCHEAIITQEEFDKIQLLIDKRRLVPVAARAYKAEFTGILRCGVCGRTLQVQKRSGKEDVIKSCQHKDEFGNKCCNRGGLLKPVKEQIKKAVLEYRNEIINNIDNTDDKGIIFLKGQLSTKYKLLEKYEKALIRVEDGYDLGDYSREEFIIRRDKWKNEINIVDNDIKLLEKDIKSQEKVTNEEKLKFIDRFLEDFDKIEDVKKKNTLYKSIFDSIVWKRVGEEEESELTINFQ